MYVMCVNLRQAASAGCRQGAIWHCSASKVRAMAVAECTITTQICYKHALGARSRSAQIGFLVCMMLRSRFLASAMVMAVYRYHCLALLVAHLAVFGFQDQAWMLCAI